MRIYYIQNDDTAIGFRLGHGPDDAYDPRELAGRYYDAEDYSVTITSANSATIVARANPRTGAPRVVMEMTNVELGVASVVIE